MTPYVCLMNALIEINGIPMCRDHNKIIAVFYYAVITALYYICLYFLFKYDGNAPL